eukprot:TRINITY_DN104145_c0_g1_i1.p1 TRINITY_DN104145_c0_g1~~TRINITY_DN104145_c0_g1_i1.p1  ORF type:complete len:1219 (-),score=262.13 TRINITY_DN104145_c0_g1_i1:108-3764(-)
MAPEDEMVDLGGGIADQQEQIYATIISAGEQAGDAALEAGGDFEAASEAAASKAAEVAAELGLMPHEAVDPTARASAQSALNAAIAADPTPMLTDISQCLDGDVIKQIKAESRRRTATSGDVVRKGDADRSDNIAPNELRAIFNRMNLTLPDETLQQVYIELDLDNTGQISFADFTRALDRGAQLRKEVGKAAAAAAGKAMGQAALAVGFPPDHAAGIAAKGAAKAASESGLPASSAARLAGRAAARVAEENGFSQSESAELAAKEAGNAASNAALQNGLDNDQMAVEAGAAGTIAATDAGMSPQDATAAGAKAAGVAAGEAMADAGQTPEKAAEVAVKAAIKAASDAGLPPHQASHAAASAAALAAASAAMSSGHSYPTVAEVAKQLDAKVFEDLRNEAQRRHITPDDLMRSGDADRNDLLSPGELKDVFRSVCIDLHDDTLRHVFQEMDVDNSGQVSFTEFSAALDHGHQIIQESGKKAAAIAGHFMGKAATEAGDDPEQAAEVAANAASKAAADSGLSPEQVAEAAVTAAGRTAGDAAAATANCTPEQASEIAGRAATRAAAGAAMSSLSLAKAIVPLIGRASGQAAGRAAGASGKDPSKAAERAARAAAQVAESMSLTPQQAEEAAEAASNEAIRAAVAAGKRAGNARGAAKGRGKATAGRGVAAKAGRGSGAGRGSNSPSRLASPGPSTSKPTPASSRSASPKAPARSPRQVAKPAAPKLSASPKAPTAARPKEQGPEQAKRPASSRPGAAKSPGPLRPGAKAKAAAAQPGREGEERAATSGARASPGRSGKESGKGSGKAKATLGPGRDTPRTEGAVAEEVAQKPDQVEVEPPLPSYSTQTMQPTRTEACVTRPPMTMFAEPVATRQGQVPPTSSVAAPSAVAKPASTTVQFPMRPYGSSLTASASAGLGSPVLVFRSPSQPAMASHPWSPMPESRAPLVGARTPVPAVPISSIAMRPATLSAPATPAAVRTSSGPQSLLAAVNTHRMPVATYTSPVVTPVRAVTGSPVYAPTPQVYSGSHAAPAPGPPVHIATANPTPPRSRPGAYPHGTMTAPPAIRSLQATFDLLDTNADGVLSREEFGRWSSQTAGSPVPSTSYATPAMHASYVAERNMPRITQAWPLTNMMPVERLRSTVHEPIATATYSPVATTTSTCPNCGNLYAADAIFCRRCGLKRHQVPTVAYAQAVATPCVAPDGTMTAPPAYRAYEAFHR